MKVLECHACGMSFLDCLHLAPITDHPEDHNDKTCCGECNHSPSTGSQPKETAPGLSSGNLSQGSQGERERDTGGDDG